MTEPHRRIPIFCYHRVHGDDDPQTPPVTPGQYCGHVIESVFRSQLAALARRSFTVVTHRELMRWLDGQAGLPDGKVAAIDFDDNRLNVLTNAAPLMAEHGFVGTMFVVSRLADGQLPHMQVYPEMNWDQLGELMERGWLIAAHTATHPRLGDLSREPDGLDRVEQEFAECNDAFERRLGFRPDHFAYPAGDWNEPVEAIVRRHYRTARLWEHSDRVRFNDRATSPYRLQSIHVSMLMDEPAFLNVLDSAS